MMTYGLENILILNVKEIDYKCVIWDMARNGAMDYLNNSELDDKGSLGILMQIKHL